MSFYSRGYRGFGSEADDRMIAAITAVSNADAAIAAATARVAAAKAAKAQFDSANQSWWQRVDSYFTSNGPYPGDADAAFYKKYVTHFPIDWTLPYNPDTGVPHAFVDGTNDVLEEDKQKAFDETLDATAALSAAKSARVTAQSVQDAAAKEIKAVNKTAEAVVIATQAKAAAAAKAQADALLPASHRASSGGISPVMIAAVAVPVVGILAYMLTRKKSAPVAGYRRRSRR